MEPALLDRLVSEAPEQWLLFHYTSLENLWNILASGEIWLKPYAKTNDPRETKEWVAEVRVEAGASDETRRLAKEIPQRFDHLLHGGARLVCFSRDRARGDDAAPDSLFHRGWAIAPMWHHYGSGHKGACFVFDWPELMEIVDTYRPFENGNLFSCGDVEYSDEPLEMVIDLSEIAETDADGVLDEYQIARGVASRLYFTKNKFWSYENEFRIVVVRWDVPSGEVLREVRIPFGPALKGVILGEQFPDERLDELRGSVAPHTDVEILRATWERGVPHLQTP